MLLGMCMMVNRNHYLQISDGSKQLLKDDLTITQMEEYCQGRILSRHVPEVISSRDSTKLKKCEMLLQTTTVWNFLKCNRSIVGLILRLLKDDHGFMMGGTKMYIDVCHSYLCCVPDGNHDLDRVLHAILY